MKPQPARPEAATGLKALERKTVRPALHNGARADLVTRMLASAMLAWLIAIGLPQLKVTYTLIKISLLFATEVGLVSLMLGLFLGARTSFAGLQLILASTVMLMLHHRAHPYAASAAGALIFVMGLVSLLAWVGGTKVPLFDAEWFRQLITGSKRRVSTKAAGDLR